MIRLLALTIALSMPGAALAHDPLVAPGNPAEGRLWLDGISGTPHADTRIRLVRHGGGDGRTAALTVNQFHAYERIYARRLTELSRHMSVHRAIPRARHDAYHAVAGIPGDAPTRTTRVAPLTAGRILGQ